MTERVFIAGSGGQGVMTIGKLLAQAAMEEGRQVTYLPSYGAEVRGGTANCSVTISDEPIHMPNFEVADTLLILNQPSYDKFRARLRPDGLLLINSTLTATAAALEGSPAQHLALPATETAAELGNVRVTNVIMLGAYAGVRGGVPIDRVVAILQKELGPARTHLVEINRQAFLKGMEAARTA